VTVLEAASSTRFSCRAQPSCNAMPVRLTMYRRLPCVSGSPYLELGPPLRSPRWWPWGLPRRPSTPGRRSRRPPGRSPRRLTARASTRGPRQGWRARSPSIHASSAARRSRCSRPAASQLQSPPSTLPLPTRRQELRDPLDRRRAPSRPQEQRPRHRSARGRSAGPRNPRHDDPAYQAQRPARRPLPLVPLPLPDRGIPRVRRLQVQRRIHRGARPLDLGRGDQRQPDDHRPR
jgi:hypothetical protein